MKMTVCFASSLVLFLVLISCDNQPRSRRLASPRDHDYLSPLPYYPEDDRSDKSEEKDDDSGSETKDDDEFSHCRFPDKGGSYASYDELIGHYTLCQSKKDNNKIAIQVAVPITNYKLCFIPAQRAASYTTHVGYPKCLLLSDSSKRYVIRFDKDRPGYSAATINGVLIMYYREYYYGHPFNQLSYAPTAYLQCMNHLERFQDPSYCAAFGRVGKYLYHKF